MQPGMEALLSSLSRKTYKGICGCLSCFVFQLEILLENTLQELLCVTVLCIVFNKTHNSMMVEEVMSPSFPATAGRQERERETAGVKPTHHQA